MGGNHTGMESYIRGVRENEETVEGESHSGYD